ncbi:MAG: glycoside hydrolase [Actinomycetota bacterium]|nr:glycoside hydrolase [Actinomycetota bacterium]
MARTVRSGRLFSGAAAVVALLAVLTSAGPRGAAEAAARQDGQEGSGGTAVAHYAGGKVVRVSNAPDARIYRVGARAIEPTLGINEKGDIFYTAADWITNVDVFRSTDGGRTWENTSPRLPTGQKSHVLSLDPYLYVSEPTGRIFDVDLTAACSLLSYSDDNGESWVTNPLACGRPVNDHQTLFSGPPSLSPTTLYPDVVYYCWNDFGAGSSCSKSLDGGTSWTATGSPAFTGYDPNGEEHGPGNFCGGVHGHGVVGPDGTVYLPKEYCGQPWLGISRDEGATWARVQVATNTSERQGSDTSVAVDAKGNLYYAYESEEQQLFLVVSRDGGEHWSRPMMISAPGVNEVTHPTLDVGDPGKVAVAYIGSENAPTRCRPGCDDSHFAQTTWNGYITMTVNALSKKPLFFSGAINAQSDPLYRGRCDFSNRCTPILDFIDIEIAPDGTPYGAFVDTCTLACIERAHNDDSAAVVGSLVGGPRLR